MRRPALLAALAGLAGACHGIKPAAVTERASDQADQMLVHMTHMLTANGVARAKVQSDTAYLFSSTQTADLRTVRVTFYDALGHETSTLTARTGSYHWRTGDMEGRGKVVVLTKDGRRLETEALRYSQAKDSVSSDVPFTFDAPDRHIVGEGFTSDPSFRNVIAKRPRGTGGGFVLPNQ